MTCNPASSTALHCGDGGKAGGRACRRARRWGGHGHLDGLTARRACGRRREAPKGAGGEAWECQKLRHANRNELRGKLPGPQRLRNSLFEFGWEGDWRGKREGLVGGDWSQCFGRAQHGLHAHPWALRRHPRGRSYQLRQTRGIPAAAPSSPSGSASAAAVAVELVVDHGGCGAAPMGWDWEEWAGGLPGTLPPLLAAPPAGGMGSPSAGFGLGEPTPPESGAR